jgi:hypothetical protein
LKKQGAIGQEINLQMNTFTHDVESESEFYRVLAELDELKIPYTYKKNLDSSFPVLSQALVYGEVTVPKEFEANFYDILSRTPGKELLSKGNDSKKPAQFRLLNVILIAYSIFVSILLLKYWYIQKGNSEDKNHLYEWSYDNRNLILLDRKTSSKIQMFTDNNYDLNFEENRTYSRDGLLTSESYDKNEDGNYEIVYFFGRKGSSTGFSLDKDDNGLIDYSEIILESKDTLKLSDKDQNGFLEIIK